MDKFCWRVTAASWRSNKLITDELGDATLDMLFEACGAALRGDSYKADRAVNTARHEREPLKAFDITPQTNYTSDKYGNLNNQVT